MGATVSARTAAAIGATSTQVLLECQMTLRQGYCCCSLCRSVVQAAMGANLAAA